MKCFVYIVLLGCFALSACNPKTDYRKEIEANLTVSIEPSDGVLQLSSILQPNYDIVIPDGTVLAGVSKVLKTESFFVIQGKSFEGDIHLFDNQCKYLKTILKKGGGPFEAANVWVMKIYQDNLYLLVNAGTEIMCYSLKENHFTDRFRVPDEIYAIADFEVLDNNKFVFYKNLTSKRNDECRLYVYDKEKNEIIQRWLPLPSESTEYISFAQKDCLYRRGNTIYFYEVFQNGIYALTENELIGYIGFEENKYTFPNKALYGNYTFDSFIDYCIESPYIWAHRAMYEGPHFITSNFNYNGIYYWNIIDKGKGISSSFNMINDDIFLNEEVSAEDYLYQTNAQDSVRYFTLSYDQLEQYIKQKEEKGMITSYWNKNKKLKDIYEKMDEDTNDLVIIFYEK